jgi:glycosyltransferase involved in cell wall biosynthesis
MKKYTILHTIETGGPGGAETVLLNLACGLDSRRFRSLVLLTEKGWLLKTLNENRIQTRVIEHRRSCDIGFLRAMMYLIRKENIDLIHSHLPDQNFYACVAGIMTGRKTLVTYHGPVELTGVKQLKKAIKLRFVRYSAAGMTVVCDYVARMLEQLGFPADKIVRIYNGIDLSMNDPERGTLRRELGLSNGARLIGMVANLRPTKGYEYFIQAARRVIERFPDSRFVAVGDIDSEIGDRCFKLVQDLNLQDRFLFLGFRDDVRAILRDLDVFVLSSVSEGFPLVALEAMAAGKPVVMTKCGGVEEIVDDGNTGFLVAPRDSTALADRICEIVGNPREAYALGNRARARVGENFSLDRMIHDYESLYERLLSCS